MTTHVSRILCATMVLCILLGVAAARTAQASLADDVRACDDVADGRTVKGSFVAWNRLGEVSFDGDRGFYAEAWEVLDATSGNVSTSGTTWYPIVDAPASGSSFQRVIRWRDGGATCYHEAAGVFSTGRGSLAKFKIAGTDGFRVGGRAFGKLRIDAVTDCSTARVERGTLLVKRGSRSYRHALHDACTLAPALETRNIGRGMTLKFDKYNPVAIISISATGPATETIRIGVTGAHGSSSSATYTVTRTKIATRRIWTGTDDYWNICVNEGRTVIAEGGDFYCIQPGLEMVDLRKKR